MRLIGSRGPKTAIYKVTLYLPADGIAIDADGGGFLRIRDDFGDDA